MAEFDWTILTDPTFVGGLRGQLGYSWWELDQRLDGITDDEFCWEPAPGACIVRPRGHAISPAPIGQGDYQLDHGFDALDDGSSPSQPPLRTIAWLVGHLTEAFFERYEWTFGGKALRPDSLTFYPQAEPAIAALRHEVERWKDRIDSLTEEQAATVGLSQATEIDAQAPFGQLVLHMNRELIHHGSEIMTLRDLYRVRSARSQRGPKKA
ncbi:MAG TPA: DinB family protein [Actinomycetales bacterium]|nr:DinB family protein [Actinomycetales bacterium]